MLEAAGDRLFTFTPRSRNEQAPTQRDRTLTGSRRRSDPGVCPVPKLPVVWPCAPAITMAQRGGQTLANIGPSLTSALDRANSNRVPPHFTTSKHPSLMAGCTFQSVRPLGGPTVPGYRAWGNGVVSGSLLRSTICGEWQMGPMVLSMIESGYRLESKEEFPRQTNNWCDCRSSILLENFDIVVPDGT